MTTDLDTARPSTAAPAPPRSPLATRVAAPRWMNARVLVGIVLVLVSVVAVARIVAGADNTVPVLVAAEDLVAGQPFAADLVEERGVMFDEGLDRYLDGAPGPGYVVVRPVDAGELVPRSAIQPADEIGDVRFVTLTVPAAEAPAGIATGDVVDVWLVQDEGPASLLLPEVTVTATSSGSGGLSDASRDVRVTLGVAAGEPVAGDAEGDLDQTIATLLRAARDGDVYLTALPAVP